MAEFVMSAGDPDPREVEYVRRESRIRGMLGLALGDAWRSDRHPRRGSATNQLACFTAEGLIRAIVRQDDRGICDEAGVIWHARLGWAFHQGIPGVEGPFDPTAGPCPSAPWAVAAVTRPPWSRPYAPTEVPGSRHARHWGRPLATTP